MDELNEWQIRWDRVGGDMTGERIFNEMKERIEKLQEENKSLTERFHKQADYIINLVEKIERLQR